MAQISLWKEIAETLARDISLGQFVQGDKLPTEASLAHRFGVNRHTVRRALAALSEDGLIYTRRGAGAFVAAKPVQYELGKRVRFTRSIEAMGAKANRQILSATTRHSTLEESNALAIAKLAYVHVAEGVAFLDDTPIAHFVSVFSAQRFPDLLDHLQATRSITQSFAALGVSDFMRKSTRLVAVNARATSAALLNLKTGNALLRSTNIDVDLDGTPVEFGRTWFAGNQIEITFEP